LRGKFCQIATKRLGMANIEDIAKAFVNHYYGLFDSNRASLAGLYQDHSMLTFEGEKYQGPKNILEKLVNLPFQRVKHHITTCDAQPTPGNGILVFVCGQLQVDDSPGPMPFAQTFQLFPVPGSHSYFVLNDLFRLNLR